MQWYELLIQSPYAERPHSTGLWAESEQHAVAWGRSRYGTDNIQVVQPAPRPELVRHNDSARRRANRIRRQVSERAAQKRLGQRPN